MGGDQALRRPHAYKELWHTVRHIYADYNSTSPVTPEHFAEVGKIVARADGNPSNIHYAGRSAKAALEEARTQVAALFGAPRESIIFTSGATEANNLGLRTPVLNARAKNPNSKPHIVCSAGEHRSILETVQLLVDEGIATASMAPVGPGGVISLDGVLAALRPETAVLALIHVNNETGIISPVEAIAAAAKAQVPGLWVHSDAVQGVGKVDLTSYAESAIDSAAASAHKIGGFKGVGCLYRRKGLPITALMAGGNQERGIRPGTENLPGVISFGIRAKYLAQTPQWIAPCCQLMTQLRTRMEGLQPVVMHGAAADSTGTTLNFHVDGIAGEVLLLNFDTAGIAVSSGSACSSGVQKPSHVLKAMGYPDHVALNSVRISFGVGNRVEDVDAIMGVLTDLCKTTFAQSTVCRSSL